MAGDVTGPVRPWPSPRSAGAVAGAPKLEPSEALPRAAHRRFRWDRPGSIRAAHRLGRAFTPLPGTEHQADRGRGDM